MIRSKRKFPAAGFGVVHVLAGLTIAAVVAAFAVPVYDKAVGAALHDECAEQIVEALEQTRQAAQSGTGSASFLLDVGSERVSVAGEIRALSLPAAAEVTITPARQLAEGSLPNSIVFFPDGTSSGGEIRIAYLNRVHVIDVDGSTGNVSMR